MKTKTNITPTRITLVIILFSLFSCRSVKKEWVKENFTEKSEIKEIKESLTSSNELIKEDVLKSLLFDFNKNLSESVSKQSESESETTTATIDIEAEFGKIKEAMVGNTKITSNGAKISVETTNNKSFAKDYESYKKETQETIEMLLNENVLLEKKTDKYSIENNSLKTELKQIKETQSKLVTKKQLGLGFVLLIVIGLVLYLIIKRAIFL